MPMDAIVYSSYNTNKIGVDDVLSGYLKAMILEKQDFCLTNFSCYFYVLKFLQEPIGCYRGSIYCFGFAAKAAYILFLRLRIEKRAGIYLFLNFCVGGGRIMRKSGNAQKLINFCLIVTIFLFLSILNVFGNGLLVIQRCESQ